MPNRQPKFAPKTKCITNLKCLLGGRILYNCTLSAQEDFKSNHSRLQEVIENAGHILFSIQSSTVSLTGQGITWDAVNILYPSTAIIFCLVSIPTGKLSSVLSVANMC